MASVETKIWMALKQRIRPIPGGYTAVFPGDVYDPTNAPYVQVQLMFNRPGRLTIQSTGPHDRLGILQLNLMYPVTLKHSLDVMQEKAGLIAAHWPTDLTLNFDGVQVRIYEAPQVMQAVREDAYWMIPVSIRWQSFV